ncbi:hypothetical protein J4457_01960 [Candidatus Woesearchaeota archaeon]|nr:hypothetical protein [Candidatus Woesearchaeota archaeon]
MNTEALREAGLTEGEIKVYLALLELGSTTTGPIVETSGIARSIIYQILDKLAQKGLVSYITRLKTKYFQAAEPKKILQFIDERKKRLEENKKKVESLLPQLLLKQQMAKENEINVYEGFKGIQTAHEKFYQRLKRGEEYLCLGIFPLQEERYHSYWERDHIRRAKAGISCKLLFNQGTSDAILKNRNSFKGCEARLMPINVQTPVWIEIYKNITVIVMQFNKEFAIEIMNQEIADSFKAYFEEFWKKSKPFKA